MRKAPATGRAAGLGTSPFSPDGIPYLYDPTGPRRTVLGYFSRIRRQEITMADIAPFQEGGLTVRTLETCEDRNQAYELRHEVYCKTLRWVAPRADGREYDRYDEDATTLGVFAANGVLAGLVRLIPPGHPFMLDDEFRALLSPGHLLPKGPEYAEVTRLTTRPGVIKTPRPLLVSDLLYKAVYRWACVHGVRFLYLVVEARYLRHLRRRGLPCVPIGPARRLGAGPACLAARLDREDFEQQAVSCPTRFREWLKADAPTARAVPPWRSPERDCAPPACASRCPYET
ncbi:acyl-homoserine-lactone synthase [Acidiferrobacter sp.]|uniref:acyl-homoserine-lactone synthase n=1 Tax=Acidiferrobacter sp. TaxID=1872107 RepID=UPI00261C53DD|nr:acyl-homoserine-lactone synthase [Acidiferrobacter sp.]